MHCNIIYVLIRYDFKVLITQKFFSILLNFFSDKMNFGKF